ncbi:hypothetical protein M3I53_13340 [Paraburkholderia sp. CNPSo 3272]|uniref:hypothetical protein n=1 Tax=Paraburkholderia sp. CNPSo 3272 TaxID=2940931 RepID=UPI0020B6B4ED|nr:hypothetical protein [Paraburkholderia sp. CNPSo 3272]MCP3724102.1 hypothetical protein [Paraburkholderia sp. CNPSo 3272]
MRDTIMHTPHPDFKSLLNIFRFASDDETRARPCKPEPEPATQPDATILAELLRARALMVRIESSGVTFPDQIYDVFVQALAAYDQKCWTEQIDRTFCITLSLLESVARHRRGSKAARAVCTDATLVNHENPGPTAIISERRNMLDGKW